ncbi:hypothetical protein SGGMMB4_01579 [Sodalis glossinidius str. 'morsitans']|uniref:Uncharacterized protein n=1 Tax=Sodalis glossinidius (strain morsitans) TaxID=343509 RepID=A0A193QH04_SODGM|nr:hypothetical protein SGGMMB4_01579 [Sodalis glossinidius str. 'morsitans']
MAPGFPSRATSTTGNSVAYPCNSCGFRVQYPVRFIDLYRWALYTRNPQTHGMIFDAKDF